MNKLNVKALVAALTLSVTSLVSASASAEQVSTEQVVSQFIMTQGKQVVAELSTQLQQNIATELNEFSIDGALTWFTSEQESTPSQQVAKQQDNKQSTSEE